MTLAEMVADVKVRIGSTPEVEDSDITMWLNEAMRVFCGSHAFSWLEKRVRANTVEDQNEYNLPTDFKSILEVRVDPTTSDPNVYAYRPYQQRHGLQSGDKAFSLMENIMWLYPTPTADGTNNIYLTYVRYPTNLSLSADSPSDFDHANMPAAYHPALVVYAFGIYQGYDEEQAEYESLMGNPRFPRPGTYNYFLKMAIKEDEQRKIGTRRRMLSKQEAIGYTRPNQIGKVSEVLKI